MRERERRDALDRATQPMAIESLDSSSSSPPPKRLRTETLTLASSSSKGKQKLDDGEPMHDLPEQQQRITTFDSEMDRDECGICLSEEGKAVRGSIDCCNHYFCFVCIMEWSKVESRCPICKRRFSSIRLPPRPGLFASERVVNVPVRDQAYDHLGNDPYEDVNCSVCHGTSDESLLITCDLCDSAAHTYCVNLGMTVPENDWFCPDCAISTGDRASIDDNGMENLSGYVNCSVCHGMSHPSLMLLCDLCDSAVHTYCVGLGMAVPENDWFCPDCATSMGERGFIDNDMDNPSGYVNCSVCHGISHPSLMLLCDLCDSAAAHTYCVGLGMAVPENDWFCHDCATSISVSPVVQEPSTTEIRKSHIVVSCHGEQLLSDLVQRSSHVIQVSSRANRSLSPVLQVSSYPHPLLPPVIPDQENR